MASQVENVVAAAMTESSTEDHRQEFKASISVAWELLQYIQTREKLGQDSSLGRAPTVTAEGPSHAWAVSCREYVEANWGAMGVLFLECLEEELMGCMLSIRFDSQGKPKPQTCFNACTPYANDTSGRSCDFDLGTVDDEIAGRPASVTFWGTRPEICALGQFVSWIAATFRLPQAGQLVASCICFGPDQEASESTTTKRFRICMETLAPVGDDDASPPVCWYCLFPSSVVASGFPVPPHPAGVGLRVSFNVMLKLAGALDHIHGPEAGDDDDGIYFRGASSILHPTAHFAESNTVQWRLVSNVDTTKLKPGWSPNDNWTRIQDLEMLRSATTVLGYH